MWACSSKADEDKFFFFFLSTVIHFYFGSVQFSVNTLSSQVQTNVTGEREIQPRERRNKTPVTTAALDRVCVRV